MDLSVIVPAYNEARRILPTLEEVTAYFNRLGLGFEVIVVDDGSEDGTAGVVRQWRDRGREGGGCPEVRVVSIPHQGKGAAVAAGVAEARGTWLLMTDADLSTPVEEWERIFAALREGAAIAVGSRQVPGARVERHQPLLRQLLGLLFGFLIRRLFPVGVVDTQCGFKGFEAKAAQALFPGLHSRGYCFDVEVLLKARALGLKVQEVPVRWQNHPDSRVRLWRDWPGVVKESWQIRREWKQGWGRPDRAAEP